MTQRMKAMLKFLNGDRREITLDPTQVRDGHPPATIRWKDGDVDENGNCDIGGRHVGIREFWLDPIAYRSAKLVRYDEVPRATPRHTEGEGT